MFSNNRGSRYGLRHVTLSVRDPKFWDFTFDEISQHDLPAYIDFVRNITCQSKSLSFSIFGSFFFFFLIFSILFRSVSWRTYSSARSLARSCILLCLFTFGETNPHWFASCLLHCCWRFTSLIYAHTHLRTHADRVHFIGNSQGTAVMFALLSRTPLYDRIIESFIAISPITRIGGAKTIYRPLIASLRPLLE